MSDELRSLLLDSLERVLQDNCTPERVQAVDDGGFDAQLWSLLEELGFPVALLPEEQGGIGATLEDLLEMLRVAAGHAAPAPLAEAALLVPWLCREAGQSPPQGIATVVDCGLEVPRLVDGAAAGECSGGPWWVPAGRWADSVMICARTAQGGGVLACVPRQALTLQTGVNLAGEARDRIDPRSVAELLDGGAALDEQALSQYVQLGALARVAQMTGAMEAALHRALQYAAEREQFGRPLAKFQAIQQQLALVAGEVAACQAVLAVATRNFGGADSRFAVAAAKIRAGEAAAQVSRIVHQVHGAMGFTQEYPLHHLTRRLWAWRDEFGSERAWAEQLGEQVVSRGEVWLSLTALA